MTTRDELVAVARQHLPPPAIEPWVSLLRPGLRLKPAEGDDPVVGQFGGDPRMPESDDWPSLSYAVLDHLLTLDLAALPRCGLELPDDGHLVFFAASNGEMGGDIRYYPADVELKVRAVPEHDDVGRRDRVPLTAVECWTVPDNDHPYLNHVAELIYQYEWDNEPDEGTPEYEEFMDTESALEQEAYRKATVPQGPSVHLIGGYGRDVQYSAAYAPTMAPVEVPTSEGRVTDTELPILLAQVDSDSVADIRWGDFGTALWTISRADLAERRFDNAEFHWNCH